MTNYERVVCAVALKEGLVFALKKESIKLAKSFISDIN